MPASWKTEVSPPPQTEGATPPMEETPAPAPAAPPGPEYGIALIFRLEDILASIRVDNKRALEVLVRHGVPMPLGPQGNRPVEMLLAAKPKMKTTEYEALEHEVEQAIKASEEEAVKAAKLMPHVLDSIKAAKSPQIAVATLTDLEEDAANSFLKKEGLDVYLDAVFAAQPLSEPKALGDRLKEATEKLRVPPDDCIYFCNSSAEVREAHKLGMRAVVFPSRTESMTNIFWAKPEGMLVDMNELPSMLTLDAWKPRERKQPSPVPP